MKNKKHIAVIGGNQFSCQTNEKIIDFADKNKINVTESNPFATEPLYISDPYRKFREEVRDTKFFEKPKSKFHK